MSTEALPIAWTVIAGRTIVVGAQSISWDHPSRDAILKCIKNEEWDKIENLISCEKAINKFGDGKLVVIGNEITYKGEIVDGALHNRILQMIQFGLPVEPLVKFLDKVYLNPSRRVVTELFNFIDKGELPITEDGNFLARKVVRGDFLDYHSGTVDWTPGKSPEMPRNQVDDDPSRTCSKGLHVYSYEYGKFFIREGGKFLVVEVDPADVVAIPYDYNHTKMRVCKATVLKEITAEDDPEFFKNLVYYSDSYYIDDEWDNDEDYIAKDEENCLCDDCQDKYTCNDSPYFEGEPEEEEEEEEVEETDTFDNNYATPGCDCPFCQAAAKDPFSEEDTDEEEEKPTPNVVVWVWNK